MSSYETDPQSIAQEQAYGDALTCIAAGETREYTFETILNEREVLSTGELTDILGIALSDALKQGVEREDIDPSWF